VCFITQVRDFVSRTPRVLAAGFQVPHFEFLTRGHSVLPEIGDDQEDPRTAMPRADKGFSQVRG
jgi:hypothetical protein